MEEGWQIPVRELLGAMLLNSSNEAAFILAEYIAGTEKEFAVMMNEMARLLDLDSAKFFNASGLPEYSDSLMASVRQNSMSVNDLFRLTCAVLQKQCCRTQNRDYG